MNHKRVTQVLGNPHLMMCCNNFDNLSGKAQLFVRLVIRIFRRMSNQVEICYPSFKWTSLSVRMPRLAIHSLVIFLVAMSMFVDESSASLSHVTCGSVVRLVNSNYMIKLHSHDIKYGSGSGQQSVTGNDEEVDGNSYWQVKGSTDMICERGAPIKCGSSIRLEHLSTGKNLHSHLFPSPLSGNQEVSAFGSEGEGDTGDNWVINCSEDFWERSIPVRLKHVDTEKWLSVSGRTYGRPINGQLEVVGSKYHDASCYWKATEGVYVKPDPGKKYEDHDIVKDEL